MIRDQLYHVEEDHLSFEDALCRIVVSFRKVEVDRDRGDATVHDSYRQLLELDAPEVVLRSHSTQLGRIALIRLADDLGWIEFILADRQDLFIDYQTEGQRALLRPTVSKLVTLLGYELHSRSGDKA